MTPPPVTIHAFAIVADGRFLRPDLKEPYLFHTKSGAMEKKKALKVRGRVVPVTVRIEVNRD